MSPILDEPHDRAHPVAGDSGRSASSCSSRYDPAAEIGFHCRIGDHAEPVARIG